MERGNPRRLDHIQPFTPTIHWCVQKENTTIHWEAIQRWHPTILPQIPTPTPQLHTWRQSKRLIGEFEYYHCLVRKLISWNLCKNLNMSTIQLDVCEDPFHIRQIVFWYMKDLSTMWRVAFHSLSEKHFCSCLFWRFVWHFQSLKRDRYVSRWLCRDFVWIIDTPGPTWHQKRNIKTPRLNRTTTITSWGPSPTILALGCISEEPQKQEAKNTNKAPEVKLKDCDSIKSTQKNVLKDPKAKHQNQMAKV